MRSGAERGPGPGVGKSGLLPRTRLREQGGRTRVPPARPRPGDSDVQPPVQRSCERLLDRLSDYERGLWTPKRLERVRIVSTNTLGTLLGTVGHVRVFNGDDLGEMVPTTDAVRPVVIFDEPRVATHTRMDARMRMGRSGASAAVRVPMPRVPR